jgi:hypothetical protein
MNPVPGTWSYQVRTIDAAGTEAYSNIVQLTVVDPNLSLREQTGTASGNAVIGKLLNMSGGTIQVLTDMGAVRIHMDPASTEIAPALDAESYTAGSKVVVIADRDVLSGDAIALKISPIPGTATRNHDRVLIAKPVDGNTVNLGPSDDKAGSSVIKDEVGQFSEGDEVVVLTHRSDSNRRGEKPEVLFDTDVLNNRLEEFAQKKFDDGDTGASGLIDKLAQDRRDAAQDRVEEAKKHDDKSVRDAAEKADEKIRDAAEKAAADPVAAIRKQAVADSELEILDCASQLLGHDVTGQVGLSAEEIQKVTDDCLGGDPGEDDTDYIPEKREDTKGDAPPQEVVDCIVGVLGSFRQMTADERALIEAECSTDDDDGEKSDRDKTEDRDSDSAMEARKAEFCQTYPEDSHCGGGADDGKGTPGTKDGESGDDEEKDAYCIDNPTDSRCGSDGGTKDGEEEVDKGDADAGSRGDVDMDAFCAVNPGDLKCGGSGDDGGGGGDTKGGTKPSGK